VTIDPSTSLSAIIKGTKEFLPTRLLEANAHTLYKVSRRDDYESLVWVAIWCAVAITGGSILVGGSASGKRTSWALDKFRKTFRPPDLFNKLDESTGLALATDAEAIATSALINDLIDPTKFNDPNIIDVEKTRCAIRLFCKYVLESNVWKTKKKDRLATASVEFNKHSLPLIL